MADLPECRVTATKKPFKYCGVEYFGPFTYCQLCSDCKAWDILFTCLCTHCIHIEIVTSLDLNSFLRAFSRFTNLHEAVDTMHSDNGSTFVAAADILPTLLSSTDFHNSLHKHSINWVRIPPYAPSQGGSWESMVKLFKSSWKRVLDLTRHKPSLIELQTFTLDAVHIVNDRPLTAVSDEPNDLAPICPSSFLEQQFSPYSPIGTFHDCGDLHRDYLYNANLAHKFWLSWVKGYLPTLQACVKSRVTKNILVPRQLVLVGDSDDFVHRGS